MTDPFRPAKAVPGPAFARAIRSRSSVAPAVACGVVLLLAGCGGEAGAQGADAGRTLDVLAAASVGEIMDELGAEFEARHPGVQVRVSVGGSADLAAQVVQGAPADVLVTADEATMARVTSDASVGAAPPRIFATNTPALVVPGDDPAGVASLADAGDPGVRLVVCAPSVPCGSAALRLAEAAGVALRPVSEELQVTDVLAKVTSGEADAGVVYASDAVRALARDPGSVRVVDAPEAAGIVNRYPVTVLEEARDADLAHAFVEALTGPAGRAALAEAGFGAP